MSGLMSCDIQTAIDTVSTMPADIPILLAGPHGVGKSEAVYQVARLLRDELYKDGEICLRIGKLLANEGKMGDLIAANGGKWHYDLGMPVVERRLSQMAEGELTGVPRISPNELLKRETTKFTQMDFLCVAYEFPVVLFFDEINRAFTSLRQATFQIADSKIFLGNKLHKNARVFVAANIGPLYQAEDFDTAEFSRYATLEINYNCERWLAWAMNPANGVHSLACDYIAKARDALFNAAESNFAPNNKYPDPRSWTRLGRLLQNLSSQELQVIIDGPRLQIISAMMVGPEEGVKFASFCKENSVFYGVQDVLTSWQLIKKKIPSDKKDAQKRRMILSELAQKFIQCFERIDKSILCSTDQLAVDNFIEFFNELPDEVVAKMAVIIVNSEINKELKLDTKAGNYTFWSKIKAPIKERAMKAFSQPSNR